MSSVKLPTAFVPTTYVKYSVLLRIANVAALKLALTMNNPTHYRRDLPHIFPKGRAIFITWRLSGSVPPGVVLAARKAPKATEGEKFVRIDKYLDSGKRGPKYLKDERIAEDICQTIERGASSERNEYDLHEYVVMPNHVHMLVTPRAEMHTIMQGIKGATARYANQILGRGGKPFWQQEYYDRFCRNDKEFHKIRGYIARNPVEAGLVARPEDWKWSSAARRPTLTSRPVGNSGMTQPSTH
jgi:REP element-mobilizing transposase RayT